MPRQKRKRLKFNEESVNDLLQEIYNDSHNIRARIARLFTKWETKVKDGVEIAYFGDAVIKLINAEAKNQDQKIMLLRYLKEVVFADRKVQSTNVKEGEERDTEGKQNLIKMVQDELNKNKNEKQTK